MNTKVTFNKVSYFVNGNATVCKMNCLIHNGNFSKYRYSRRIYESFTVTGVAKCNENDEFNEVLGRRIAESRAKRKAYKYADTILKDDIRKLANEIVMLCGDENSYRELIEREKEHYQFLIKDESSN